MGGRLGTCLVLSGKKNKAFKNKYLRKLLRVSYSEHNTNHYVRINFKSLMGRPNRYSQLLSAGRYGLATSHTITAPARPSCKAVLKMDATGYGNARAGQKTECTDITMPEPEEVVCVFYTSHPPRRLKQSRA